MLIILSASFLIANIPASVQIALISAPVAPSVRFTKILGYYYEKKFDKSAIEKNKIYNTKSEAFLVTTKLFDKFYQTAINNNSLPIIIIFPDINDQYRYRQDKTRRYEPLLEYFNVKKYNYIDILKAFENYEKDFGIKDLVVGRWGHYSPLGNKLIAEYIANYLEENEFTSHTNIHVALKEEKNKINQ